MTERVLIVDDEPMVCDVVQLVLGAQGFETHSVATCAAARDEARPGRFAAALIDKNLPDGSGVDLLSELHASVPDTALLIMTGYSSFDSAVTAMRLGARDYLVKPFSTLDEVALRVRRAVDDFARERRRITLEADLRAGLVSAQNELLAIFEAAAEPILIFDLDGRVHRFNAAASAVYAGLTPGMDLAALGDRDGAEAIARARRGEVARRERVVRTTGKGPIAMNATVAPIRDHRGNVVALVETAISVEETLRAQRALHQADKLSTLGALAATLAHELANPIGSALANMATLGTVDGNGRVTGTDPADAAAIIDEVRLALEHSRDIIRRTREYSAPNQNARGVVSLRQVVDEAVRFVGPQLTHKARVEVEVPADLEVKGERTGLIQMFMNLLVNAAHAVVGRPGPAVRVLAREEAGEAVISVVDNGCGIAAAELPRIWDRFFTTKPADQGTGLGLAVCRDVARNHGGNIRVQSEVGRGTTFEVRLPLSTAARPVRILVVDDDPLVLAAMARQLRGHFEVCTAASAEEALALLSDDGKGVQIVLSDLMMPGVDGAELLRQVGHRFPSMKRLVMTANNDPALPGLVRAQAGAVEILSKPLNAVALRTRLLSELAQTR